MLQAKPLKRARFNIFKSMAWYDLILFFILVILDFVIVIFGFPQISSLYKIIIPVAFIPVIMLLFLNVKNTSYKVYQIFWIWLKFLSSKKKFNQNEIENLLVFKTIDDNGVLKTEPANKTKKEYYAKLLKLNGNSIFKYDNNIQEDLLTTLASNIGNINDSINIIKINNQNEFRENIFSIDEKLKKFKDEDSQNYLLAKQNDLLSFKNQKYQEYYILVYGENEFALNENISNVKFAFESSNFLVLDQNQIETVLFFNNFYGLNSTYNDIELKILNYDSKIVKLIDLLDYKQVEFAKNHFKLNDYLYSLQAIKEFDYEVDNGWINTVYDSNSNVILNLNKLSLKNAEHLLESANRKLGALASENSHHFLRDKKKAYEYEIFTEMTENIVKYQTKPLMDVSIYFLNKGNNVKELNELEKINENNAFKEKIKLSKFNYEQFKVWNQTQLPSTDILNTSIQALPELVAYGWPWNLEILNDNNDFILATQLQDNSPVFFDLFYRNAFRRNNNAIIIGTSGGGKSTLSKKMLLNEYYDGAQILIIDPQNEYNKICNQVKGQLIDLKDGNKTVINPLEIQINEFNDENIKVYNVIDNHIEFVSSWFEILFQNISKTELIVIKQALKNLYIKHKFYECKTIEELRKVKKWPLIDNFIIELQQTTFENELEKHIYEIPIAKLVKEFKFFFQEQRSYKNIFNAKSNINLNNKFIVFNVKKLLAQQNQASALAQIYLLLKIINTKISINSINKQYYKTVLFIDEAHFALKDNTPQLREFVIDTTKTIRKFNGSIILATQNVVDISQNASKILGNIQYSFFFNCKQLDLNSIQDLYKTNQSLTEQELKFISNAKTGECLMFLNDKQHYQIAINYNDFEKDLLFDDFTVFKKHIKVLKNDINSLLNKLNETDIKEELIIGYNKEIETIESNLSTYITYMNYLNFLVEFKDNLINSF
ncbi:conjugal transfer ATP-binding protein TraC [Mycoplasmopsis maculosa]|uniref:Conjugal transfer ATP-binding protein TraC n=1 Tax=Mycoplasmopsis maculosa TaxID=114885 RepID=A0A449B5G3_9BACT|nr:ATP-binding protein [Mycoplasmopsis maculosa]VEU75768.1 conjugal transfer ATP-binding protein TraC [Mycoplasmopsis maculosa]